MINDIKKHKLVRQEDFVASKKLGQNFLFCVETQKKIVNNANIEPSNDLVIEIGPGFGAITKHILDTNVDLIAIELDKRLYEHLFNNYHNYPNFKLIQGDVLKINFDEMIKQKNKKIKVVANLPYYISSKIILKLLKSMMIDECVIMVQKEMAERISAKVNTKDYNAFTVLLSYYCNIQYLFTIKPHNFKPAPKVNSAIVKINFFNNKKYDSQFDDFLKLCFHSPRKTLINNLSYSYDKSKIMNLLLEYNYDLNIRPQMLDVHQFYELYERLKNENKSSNKN